MSEIIYDNVIRTETLDRGERVEMMVDIYEISDAVRNDERQQELQHTGSVSVKNRRQRAVQVCLWLLCVLLLSAVIVLCVYYTTERNHLLTHNYNLTEEREKRLTEYTEILNQNRNSTEEKEQIKNKIHELQNALQDEKHQCLINTSHLSEERDQLINERTELNKWLTKQDWTSGKWIFYNFSFYFISSDVKRWSNSREDCKQREADLVIINNKEEQEFLQMFTDRYDHNDDYYYYWIGLSKKEGVWKWVDETTLTRSHWMKGYPYTYYDNCALTSTSGWIDYSCYWSRRWICEKRV